MNTRLDAAGRTLALNDTVMGTYGGYSGLSPMVVVGFTPKAVRCEPLKSLHGISGRGGGVLTGERLVRFPSQIVLVETGDGTTLESRRPDTTVESAAG
ncbi:hypothetical protein [Arthrobacter caoxuetaonis]|uniref:Uncharacterized protein n=1 Tax=Arthrobacter caoxuetaonis TaxID=2886935 RepID=A0A9X1MGF3_9MICC|nr:hypothetical protein [Arthrobacter caoxuetaonis]MCC3299658.1 hypothetical protein [Arthrobacter caoxuetaonis]USQ59000.1 hypothetical protein NF551_18005 [Arthrobacter caoxuetaonis]